MTTTDTELDDPLATCPAAPLQPDASDASDVSYAATHDPRELWRRARLPLALVLLLVLTALIVVAFRQRTRAGAFDPGSVEPQGSRALAELLKENGADINRVLGLADRDLRGTVFVPFGDELPDAALDRLMTPPPDVDVVVVAPYGAFEALGVPINGSYGRTSRDAREPGCAFAPATTAGAAHVAGNSYDIDEDADASVQTCYPSQGLPSLVHVARAGSTVTILGSGEPFTNDLLDEEGNAALALALLGRGKPITWVMRGRAGDLPTGEGGSFGDLLPDGAQMALLQLWVAAFVAMLWRGRRLGPVVTEPLPVIVRAAEAVEGRGRLYAAAKARDRAGWNLRRSARARLRTRLRLPPDAGHEALVDRVSERSSLRPENVGRLLYGPDPADDESLVRLAADLDDLDSEVRRS